jgi:hypothetical protein
MRAKQSEYVKAAQLGFGWFEEMCGSGVGVMTMCVFKPERISGDGSRVFEGRKAGHALDAWLRFFSPLSSRGMGVRVTEFGTVFEPAYSASGWQF